MPCISKRLLVFCLSGFAFTNTPLSAAVTVKLVRTPATNVKQEKNKQDNGSSNKQLQLKQSIIDGKNGTAGKQSQEKKSANKQLPQQGGLPKFVPTGAWQTIKGEGEGAGDTPVIEERGGMPEFNISGSCTIFPVFAKSSISYYNGNDSFDFIDKSVNLKSDAKTKFDQTGVGFDFEGELIAGAKLSLTDKLKSGASIEIQAVKDDFEVDKAYVFLEHQNFGKLLLGNTKGPDSTFDVGGQSLIGGAAGINGTILSNLDYPTGVFVPRAVVGNSNKASKIVFISPSFKGFQLGMAFTPDTKLHGHDVRARGNGESSNGNNAGCFTKGKDGSEKPNGRNNFAIGLRYEQEIAPEFTIRGSAVFVTESTQKLKATVIEYKKGEKVESNGKGDLFVNPKYKIENGKQVIDEEKSSKVGTKEIKLNNAKSFLLSLGMTFRKLTISASYLNCGKSRLPALAEYTNSEKKTVIFPQFMCEKDGNAGRAWNIGGRYDWNNWAFACVYWNTSRQITKSEKTKGHIFTVTVDRLIKPGFKVFFEVDYIKSKSSPFACAMYNLVADKKNGIAEQSGFAVLAGFTLQF